MPYKNGSKINNSTRKDDESLKLVQNTSFRVENRKVLTVLKKFKILSLFVTSLALKCCQMGPKFQILKKSPYKHKVLHICKVLYLEFEFEDNFQNFKNFAHHCDVTSSTGTGSNGPKFSNF